MKRSNKHILWLVIWLAGLAALGFWDALFLNRPALGTLLTASANSLLAGLVVVMLATGLGWVAGSGLYILETRNRAAYLTVTFILNILRSLPQIVGILLGYVLLTLLTEQEVVQSWLGQLMWMAFTIGVVVLPEVSDLVRDRIVYYSTLDFYPAMLCSGVKERRIINREILWKNSRAHLLQKMVSVLGIAIFLQCSIDFVVSVGLSTDVSLTNFPPTLGNLLAKLDSKQDILAIGNAIRNPLEAPTLFFEHLQGVSVAFLIVFTLVCLYNISNGIVRRYKL